MHRILGVMVGALAVALALTITVPAGTATANSCNGAKHKLTLSTGTASPGTGLTSTSFTFSVRYQDNAGCQPTLAELAVPGVGTFPLTANGTNWSAGVMLSVTIRLPAGTWNYAFTAASGSGNGSRIITLTKVSPSAVKVTNPPPPPTPTPKPTPRPTPRPTPHPTPRPTPKPTAKPASKPTAKPSARPTQAPSGSNGSPGASGSAATESPGIAIIGGPGQGGGASEPPFGAGTLDGGSGGSGFPGLILLPILAAFVAGGSTFAVVAKRRRRGEPVTVVVADVGAPAVLAAPTPLLPPGTADPLVEAHLPRWRRPSLQAARRESSRGRIEESSAYQLTFRDDERSGAERRRVRYRLVRLSDAPDEIRSMEIGQLEANDEVEVLDQYSGFIRVRTPLGTEGWVHRTTLGPPIGADDEDRFDANAGLAGTDPMATDRQAGPFG